MKPYYDEDGITIYHGDCREILPSVPPVECVVTDPPYGIGFRDYASHEDAAQSYADDVLRGVFLAEEHVLPGCVCVVFQSETTVRFWPEWFPRPFRLMAICKTFGQISRERLMRQTDYAIYWTVADVAWTRAAWESVVAWQPANARNWCISSDASRTRERPDHPCPRPLDAMRYVISCFVPPGGTVLDPFMGSGTTLVAAKQLGRRAIGIEIEERYCEIAAKRLQQGVLPFMREAAPKPEQVSLLDGEA